MKKTVLIVLSVLLLFAVGCSSSEPAVTVKPLNDAVAVSESLTDGTYAASFQTTDLKNAADGWTLTVTLADYDRFEPDMIASLKVGDRIEVCGKEVEIGSVSGSGDYIEINGGYEKGGVSLTLDEGSYRTMISDGYPQFRQIGIVTLPLGKDFLCSDQGGDDPGAEPILTGTDELPDSLGGGAWAFHNTRVNVAGGKIIMIYRFWTP